MENIQNENIISKKKMWKIEKLVFNFFFYSFIGFIIEEIIFFIINKQFIYRGFLYLPILPIYGFGSVIISLVYPDKDFEVLSIFFIGALFCSILEYGTSFILEKSLNLSLWNYNDVKFNLNGRVSLISSVLFGFGAVLMVKVINPIIEKKLRKYKNSYGLDLFLSFLIILTFIDFTLSLSRYLEI